MNIEWTHINNDVNGNPRFVCHFLNLSTEQDKVDAGEGFNRISLLYAMACKRANRIGGRKYHTKKYGGGIVFQSYELKETEEAIARILED